jgi:hypothetical protein
MRGYLAPSIMVIENAIDYSDEILSTVLPLPDEAWRSSEIESPGDRTTRNEVEIRRSREIQISPSASKPKIFFDLSLSIHSAAKEYSTENGFEFSHMEDISLLRYDQGEGFYDRHCDCGPTFPRSMSALLYLNDVVSGGETWFDKFNLNIRPERGKLVLFPANYAYTHQALPPTSGPKYVVVTWFGQSLDPNIFKEYFK